jgi:hypothetical protein
MSLSATLCQIHSMRTVDRSPGRCPQNTVCAAILTVS